MPKAKAKPPEELTFEQAFEELQEVVAGLESGELALEDSLKLSAGQGLADRCSQLPSRPSSGCASSSRRAQLREGSGGRGMAAGAGDVYGGDRDEVDYP
jgi:exodeoxyribonuclease VII small subunit